MKAKVEKIVSGGYGLCRTEQGVVLVPFVVPGEEVELELEGRRKGVMWGKVKRILKPSPHRIQPPCKFFGLCGGCQLQHMDYRAQLEAKKDMVLDNFQRIGKFTVDELELVPSPPWGYRTKIYFKAVEGRLGFFKRASNELVEVDSCLLASDEANRIYRKLRFLFKEKGGDYLFVDEVVLLQNPLGQEFLLQFEASSSRENLKEVADIDDAVKGVGWGQTWYGKPYLEMRISGHSYLFSPSTFIQSNRFLLNRMLELVREWAGEGNLAYDLYAGTGFFSMVLAERYKKVVAVESNPSAEQLFKIASQLNGSPPVEFVTSKVENCLFDRAELFLLDPPRGGISKRVFQKVVGAGPSRIIYFSCDSAAVSRDLRWFLQAGFSIERAVMLDLFPQTAHVELAFLLVRKEVKDIFTL